MIVEEEGMLFWLFRLFLTKWYVTGETMPFNLCHESRTIYGIFHIKELRAMYL